jgi:hypothetical protein
LRHPVIKSVGFFLLALLFGGALVGAIVAAKAGQPFMGVNAWGIPIGTYTVLAIFAVAGACGGLVAATRVRRVINRRLRK